MAADLTGPLKAKIGPLPGYAWAGAAAGGIALVVLALRNRKPATGSSVKPPAGISAGYVAPPTGPDYSLGYSQGLAAAAPPPTGAATAPAPSTAAAAQYVRLDSSSGSPIALFNASNVRVAFLPSGSVVQLAGTQASNTHGGGGLPITWLGGTYYVDVTDPGVNVTPVSTAQGGGRGGPSIGSRSSRLMHYAHPDVKRAPRFSHFAAGPPAALHGRGLANAAQRAGVHPARLAILNRPGSGYLRVA